MTERARYSLTFAPSALRTLRKLDHSVSERIRAAAEKLCHDPRPPGALMLRGTRGAMRLRVGDYRLIYEIHDAELVVLVLEVGHRREVYRSL